MDDGSSENIPANPSHGGRFIEYNIFGNIFEVTSKYKPPVLPIGKGAYGIVWLVYLSYIISNRFNSIIYVIFNFRYNFVFYVVI